MAAGKSACLPLVLLTLFLLLVVASLAFLFMGQTTVPIVPVPSPNAFDGFVTAGHAVIGVPDDVTQAAEAELEAFLNDNSEAMEIVQASLSQPGALPLEYQQGTRAALESVGPLKQCQRLLFAKARLAELQGRPREAVDTCLQLISMGDKVTNGALLLHLLLAQAYERLALEKIRDLASKLNEAERQEVLQALEAREFSPTRVDEVMQRERAVHVKQHGWLASQLTFRATASMTAETKARVDVQDQQLRQLYQAALADLQNKPD